MASAARGATAPRLKQVNLSERALRLLRVDIARINVGKPHMVTISDPLRSAAAVPVLDLAKHLGAEVVGAPSGPPVPSTASMLQSRAHSPHMGDRLSGCIPLACSTAKRSTMNTRCGSWKCMNLLANESTFYHVGSSAGGLPTSMSSLLLSRPADNAP